jgi:hypothetical protein
VKKADLLTIVCVILFFAPFFIFKPVYDFYSQFNREHGYIMSALKFMFLATFGEMLSLRIRTGRYYQKGFGLIPRMIVWAFIGILIKIGFAIFSPSGPVLLASIGINITPAVFNEPFTAIKLLAAFTTSLCMNLIFAPVFMTFHKITDEHISRNGGTIRGFFTPIKFYEIFPQINWNVMWGFVYKKTIPLFWIPAHTITFLLPEEFRVLFAAILGIVLGVILGIASLKSKNQ